MAKEFITSKLWKFTFRGLSYELESAQSLIKEAVCF